MHTLLCTDTRVPLNLSDRNRATGPSASQPTSKALPTARRATALPFVCLSVSMRSKGEKAFKQPALLITAKVTQFHPCKSICSLGCTLGLVPLAMLEL